MRCNVNKESERHLHNSL